MSEITQSEDGTEETFDRETLAEDAQTLVAALEAIHPDPYIGYDGRVGLHSRLERLVRDLPETATAEEFYRRAAPLVSGMGDSHSLLRAPGYEDSPDRTEENHRLPVSFRVVGDRIYVESVFDGALTDLLGARLLAVEGESVATLTDRGTALRGAENQYTALLFASGMIEKYAPLARLLEQLTPPAEPTVRVEVDGAKRSVTLTPIAGNREPTHELDETFPHPTGTGPRYRLYENGDAAVFVPGDLQGYRESFEVRMDIGGASAADLVPAAYDRHVGSDSPDDLSEMVAALPSMTETLTDLVDDMVAADTKILIVDLRGNPGGDSQFVFHVGYMFKGWEGVTHMSESVRSLKRRTGPHRERYGTGGEGSVGIGTADDNPAAYDFTDFLDDPETDESGSESRTKERLILSDTFAEIVEAGSHEAAYEPDRIVVAVSASTMSSAFAGTAQLTSLGAEVVGVPSGQAPLSFGEPVEEALPNTGLTVRIAGSMYHWIPDPDSNILQPDRELTPALFERYDRTADAGLRLAFDHAGVTDSDGSPPEPFEQSSEDER